MKGEARALSDIGSEIVEKYNDWSLAYREEHRRWIECFEFLDGNQYSRVRDDLSIVDIPLVNRQAIRIVENRMGPVARVAVSKLLATPYEPQSEPLDESVSAMQQGKARDGVLMALSDMTSLHESVMKPAAIDFLVTRLAITRTMWRPFLGEQASKPAGKNANLSYYQDSARMGGYVYVYAVSPLRWIPAPWSTYDNVPEVIEVHTLHKSYMEDTWGLKACEGATPIANATVRPYGFPRSNFGMHYQQDVYVVFEYFRLPTKQEPFGRHVICTSGRTLYDSRNDQMFKQMGGIQRAPYAVATDLSKGTHLIGRGLLLDAVPLQKALNAIVSQVASACNRAMSTPMTIPKDSKIEFSELVGGTVIEVNQAQRGLLGMVEAPRFPAEGFQLADVYRRAIPDVVGVHDSSQGDAPGLGVGSGKAIGMLASLDATKFGPMAEAFQRLHVVTYDNMEEAFRANVDGPQTVQLLGEDRSLEVYEWLSDSPSKFRTRIRPIPAQFKSLAQHREDVLRAYQLGVLRNQAMVLGALGLNEYVFLQNADRQAAREENTWFMNNMDPRATLPTSPYEDQEAHAVEHKLALMHPRLAEVAKTRPWVRIQLEEHLYSHMRRAEMERQGIAQPEVAGAQMGQPQSQQPGGQPQLANPSAQGMPPSMFTPGGDGTKRGEQSVQLEQAGASEQGASQGPAAPAPLSA